MFDWFKKRAKGVAAQINPFDGGKTYSSVVSQPQRRVEVRPTQPRRSSPAIQVPSAPRQTQFSKSLNNFASVDQPTQKPTFTAPKQQVLKTPGFGVFKPEVQQDRQQKAIREYIEKKSPGLNKRVEAERRARQIYNKQSLAGKVADNLFNANSAADRAKRVAAGESADYRTQQINRGNKRPAMNFGQQAVNQVVGGTTRLANTAAVLPRSYYDASRATGARMREGKLDTQTRVASLLFANPIGAYGMARGAMDGRGSEQISRQGTRDIKNQLRSGGIAGRGSVFSDDQIDRLENLSPQELAKISGASGIETASEILPMSKGAKIGYRAGGKSLARQLPRIAAEDTALGAMGSAGRQYIETGRIDPKQVALDTLMSVGMGQASTGMGAGFRRVRNAGGVRNVVDTTPNNAPVVKVDAPDPVTGFQRVKRAWDRVKIDPDDQGGYIQAPGRRLNRSKIHPDDQNIMSDFIDYARGIYRPNRAEAHNLQLDAARIAEHYGLDMPPTVNGLADSFDDVLSRNRFGMRRLDESGHLQLPGGKSDPLDDLRAEARKYKSAEEFVGAVESGKVDIPKLDVNDPRLAEIQKSLGIDFTNAYDTPNAKYNMQKKAVENLYNQATAPVQKAPEPKTPQSNPEVNTRAQNDRVQQVAETAKSKARKVYEATGDVSEAKKAHNGVIDRARELSSQKRVRRQSTDPAPLDNQARNPSQSQSVDSSQLPQKSPEVVGSSSRVSQKQEAPQVIRQSKRRVQPARESVSSSDNIIDLKTIDVNDPFNNRSAVGKLRNEFGRYFIDEDAEMINLFKKIEKETGSKDIVEQWLQDTDLVRASNSIANSKIRNNKNLSDAIHGLKKRELTELDTYAAARSELHNVSRGLDRTSKSVAGLQATVKRLEGKYSKRFDSLNKYYNDLAKDLHEAGIIDKQKLDSWAKNKDYVRVQRDMEDLLEPNVGGSRSRSFGSTSTAKKRTGSQRDILSSTETALKRTQEIQLEIQRNKAASNTIDTLSKYGLAERIPSSQATGKNIIKRFKDGKAEYFATNKDIKRVIDSVNPVQLGMIARVISAPTRLFRAGTTALSAPFAVTNYMRDQASSAIYGKRVWSTHSPKNIVAGLREATKDFAGVQNNELWRKFESIAGDQTIFDELRNTKNSKRMLTELRLGSGKAKAKSLINPLDTVRNLEDLIGITEKSTRFQNFKGIYEKAIKDGLGEDVAIRRATQAALQNSVNFSRAGQIVRIANMVLPYFNAGIQGSRNVARSLRDRPVSTLAKSTAFVALPTIGATFYNYSDDERRKIYENIPETEKENNILFVLPGAKQREDGTYEGIIKIPKPQGYRELTDPMRVYAEKFAGAEDSKSVGEMLKDMAPAFTGPVQTSDMNKFQSSLTPQILKPALQAHLNKDLYWNSDTVPDYISQDIDDPTKQAYKNTSGTARFIADRLGVSPIKVEKFIVDTSGSIGRYGINASDNILAKQGAIPQEQIGGRSMKSDFSRRMFETRGIEKDERLMTSGQKYFKAVNEATKGLNSKQRAVWDSYNQSNKNYLGEVLYDKNSQAKKQAKAAAYLQHPELFDVDKRIDAQSRKRGEPGNPLYDLTYEQAKMIVQQKALPPGAKDEGLNTLYDQHWYQRYKNKESSFYEAIFKGREQKTDNPYPQRSKALVKAMDYYYDLPSSAAKRQFKQANPGIAAQMDNYYKAKDVWTNKERAKLGLPPIDTDNKFGYSSKYTSGGRRSGGRGGSRKTATPKRASRSGEISTAAALAKLAASSGKGLKAQKATYKKTNTKKTKSSNKKLARASTRGRA